MVCSVGRMAMKTCVWIGVIVAGLLNVTGADEADIRLNSLGFLPDGPKIATVIAPCETFQILDADSGDVVFSGRAQGPTHQADVDQDTWTVDFTPLKQQGRFSLVVPKVGQSNVFSITSNVYDQALVTTMRAFYLWRCGTDVTTEYNGQTYAQKACHLEDGYQDHMGIGMHSTEKRDGTGGWHDAGDFGKYTVNAGVTLGCLFMAWDQYGEQLKYLDLDLPDTAPGYPDFLKELKWETDWLLKMEYPDGSGRVSHKLTRLGFSGFVMPSTDTEKRYFTDWGTAAIADFTAVMALAARHFKPYDSVYADQCLAAAKRSYAFLTANPQYKRWNQRQFTTGGYQSRDDDDRIWAAAELWETTGDPVYLKDFEARATGRNANVDENWDWGDVSNLGLFTYARSERAGRNVDLVAAIRTSIVTVADQIVSKAQSDVYGRPLGRQYYWGCNGTVARQVMNLRVAHEITPKPAYRDTALCAIDHIFGRNYYNRSYVTGLGIDPPMNPHDRRSGADGIEAPWPGYIVGGGQSATNWTDIQDSYQTNEIAINWQGALVYALTGWGK